MNRTLTAAVALAAGLGMAGLAQAQQNNSNYEQAGKPSAGQQAAPSAFTSPSTTSGGTMAPSQPAPMQPGPQANTTQGTQQPNMQNGQQGSMHQANMQGSEPRMMRGGREHTTVAQAQQELKSQGLYNGPIDGVPGRQTKTALSQFQQQNGLKKTAMLDRETRDRLTQGAANPSGATNR